MASQKDPRLKILNKLFEYKQVSSWKDITTQIPKSVMRELLHTNHYRMKRIYTNPGELQYDEAATLAGLIGIEHRVLSELIESSIMPTKDKSK